MTVNPARTVPRSIFSVDDFPIAERFDYWRHSIAAIFDVDAVPDVVGNFHATIDSHLVGPLMLARTCSRRQHWVRSSRTVARDGMDHYMVQLYESGGQTVRFDGKCKPMDAGQLIVCDLQRTMDNHSTDFQNLSILVPRTLLAEQLEYPDAAHGLIIDGAAPLGRILREHLTILKEIVDGLTAGDVQGVAEATVNLIAVCVNGVGRAAQGKPVAPAPPLLSRIKRYILDNLHDPMLTPEIIAKRQGVSRTKLYEMFEPEGGVFAYMRLMRLKAAFDALRDPHQAWRSIYDIALEVGYNSDAAFSRAFKSMFDVPPSEVRRVAAMAIQTTVLQASADRRYEEWLRSLGPSTAIRQATGVRQLALADRE